MSETQQNRIKLPSKIGFSVATLIVAAGLFAIAVKDCKRRDFRSVAQTLSRAKDQLENDLYSMNALNKTAGSDRNNLYMIQFSYASVSTGDMCLHPYPEKVIPCPQKNGPNCGTFDESTSRALSLVRTQVQSIERAYSRGAAVDWCP